MPAQKSSERPLVKRQAMKLGIAHDPGADGALIQLETPEYAERTGIQVGEQERRQLIPLETPEYTERAAHRRSSPCPELYDLLDQVRDPELPELSIWDLGVLRDVCATGDEVRVTITPTYSGCPALGVIREDIAACLAAAGHARHCIEERTAPAWTTSLLSRAAHEQLRAGGVAPPVAESRPPWQLGEPASRTPPTATASSPRPAVAWQPGDPASQAPPAGSGGAVGVAADPHHAALGAPEAVPCPRCGSGATTLVSAFASTACKAHYRCNACLEPFDHFKAHL